MTTNMIAAVSAALALVIMTVLAAQARPGQTLPLAVHNGIWAGGFLLVGSELVHYTTISSTAWIVLLSGITAFNVGYLVMTPPDAPPDHPVDSAVKVPALTSGRMTTMMLGAYSLGFAIYLVKVLGHYGLATVLTNPGAIRGDTETAYLTLVPFWARLLMFLGPLLFALFATDGAVTRKYALPVRLAILAYLGISMISLLQRTNLFLALLWTISIVLFRVTSTRARTRMSLNAVRTKRSRLALQAGGTALIAVLGLASFQLVAVALGKQGEQALSTGAISAPLARSGLTSVVTYATGGIVAFGQLVDSTNESWPDDDAAELNTIVAGDYNPQTWGGATFSQFMRVVPVVEPWEQIATFVEIPFYFNVYTWYESLYRDFRTAGVVFGMLTISALLAISYRRRLTSATAFWAGSYLLSLVFMCTFNSRFTQTLDIVSLAAALTLGLIADRRRRRTVHAEGATT